MLQRSISANSSTYVGSNIVSPGWPMPINGVPTDWCAPPSGASVRPDGVASLEPKSVKKKLKAKEFAAAVSRQDIATGLAELGVDETQHIQTCIDAIRGERERLGV